MAEGREWTVFALGSEVTFVWLALKHHFSCPDLSTCWCFHAQTYCWDLPSSHHLCLLCKIHLNRIHPVLLVALGSTDCPAFLKDGKVGLCWEIKLVKKAWNWIWRESRNKNSMTDIPIFCATPSKPLPIYIYLVTSSPYSKVHSGFLTTMGAKFKILSKTFKVVYY